jgi:endonuclease/exonuclease/phosphatase family metal-dependent hydrolase
MPNLRLLTLNIAHGRGLSLYQGFHSLKYIHRNLDRIAHLLRRLRPDVVALQEVDESSHWNKHINLLDYLQENAAYSHAFLGVHNRRKGTKRLAYGNAILSHHLIHSSEAVPFGTKTLGEKGYIFAEVTFGGLDIPVINLHLDYRSRRIRTEQVEQIIDDLDSRSRRLNGSRRVAPIIFGDFNTSSKSSQDAVQHLLTHVQQHTDYRIFPKEGRTFPAHFPRWGYDFFFVPAPYEVISCRVIRSYVSDHRPVLLQIRIPKSQFISVDGDELEPEASGS